MAFQSVSLVIHGKRQREEENSVPFDLSVCDDPGVGGRVEAQLRVKVGPGERNGSLEEVGHVSDGAFCYCHLSRLEERWWDLSRIPSSLVTKPERTGPQACKGERASE